MNVVNVKNTAEPITPVEKIGGCNTAGELLAALGGGLLRTTAGVRILGDYSLESIQDLDWTPPASGIRPDQLCFSYQGKRLEDDGRTLTEYGIERSSVLRVVLRLPGGGGGSDDGGGRGVQPLATTLALMGRRPGPLRRLSRGAASAGRLLLLRAGDVERNPGMATVDTAYVEQRLEEARVVLGEETYGRMVAMFDPPPDWTTWINLKKKCDTPTAAASFFLTKWPPPMLESSNLTDRGHLGQPLPKPGADWPQSESLNTGGRAFEYAPTTVTCWESVADVPLDAKITQFRDRVDDVERRWLPTGVLATPINSEAAVSGAVQMLVGEACTLILQKHQQQQIFAAPAAVWETQPRSDIIQAAVAYAAQQRSVQPTSSSNALAHFFAPSAGATASSGIKRKVDMALMVAEPATPAAQQSTERGGGLSPAGEEAGPSDAAPTPDRPKKRRCICVGELKRASKLMIRLDQPVDLVAAWNDAKHKYHMQAKAVVRQQYTYMMLWQLCYGFISCYFGTWLVYCPPNPPEARRGLFVSRAYLATDGSPKVTALAAVAWIHQQAVCSMQELVAAHPDPPLLATDCDEAAADDDGLPDAGARTDSASAYSPSSQALREADESGGSSNAGQGSALLKLPACAPSNRLRLYSELCRGSEGLVMRGLYGGVDAVVKLLGPDSAGLAAFTREAAVLAAFAPLAGQAAPRLLGAGHIRAGVHFIATAYMAGQPLSSLQHVPRHVAAAVQHAYGRLRSLQPRFLHGDVHSRNILLLNGASGSDTCLTCIFLDFGRSRLDASAAEQQAEKRKLQSLLAD